MALHLKSLAAEAEDYGQGLAAGARAPASYAAGAVASRGRYYPEPECPTRNPFQRDRDRVLHSTAFRRLTYKTQVFLFHEGDHYRSRLTHSLEVAQIARTMARQLRLDEDLAEALALSHDLGHSPYGHAGERALQAVMGDFGGFDHNAQSLRVVTRLERKYPEFDGLNLTWESLEGLAKHNGPVDADSAVAKVTRRFEGWRSLDIGSWPSGEAQVAALSDDIAYLSHDIDDGLRAGLIEVGDLDDVGVVGPIVRALRHEEQGDRSRRIYSITRRMITVLIRDVVVEARSRLAALHPASPDDIRAAGHAVVAFSAPFQTEVAALRAFLFARVYRHERVMKVMRGAEQVVTDLFTRYLGDDSALPETWRKAAEPLQLKPRARLIGDFVAGMTDRYALAEHRRLFDLTPDLR
jgi:dGTPase